MSTTRDWLPTTRTGQLEMARNWFDVLSNYANNWEVPQTEISALSNLMSVASNALEEATLSTRNETINARCREAFAALVAKMRWIKKKYFTQPPLLDSDLVMLGLKPPDTTPTTIGPPVAQVTATVAYPGKASLELRITPVAGHAYDERAEWGFRIYYGVLPHGGADQEEHLTRQHLLRAPVRPEELQKSHFTRRKKDVLNFEYDESAMKCYICIRYENGKGEAGPWGPMVEAVIP